MSDNIAIKVENISKSFKLPHESSSGVKQAVLNVFSKNKGYEIQQVLKNVSFEIEQGDFFGIVGRNGSGKSTLLKLLAGIYTPDKGAVHVRGTLTPFIELGVGFNQELTGSENVYLNGALLGFSRKQIDEIYDDIVEFAELGRFMDQKLKNYSSGMQVRLAFSIAIRADSDILILDEVLAVGDAAFQQKCFDYFESLKSNRKTVVLVTHDMSSVKRFCNKAMIISSGEIEAIGSPSEVADVYTRENIEVEHTEIEQKKHINTKILNKKNLNSTKKIELSFSYDLSVPHYIGISLLKDGVIISELNSKETYFDSSKKQTNLELSINLLNPGAYEIGVALFEVESGALIDFDSKAASFLVEGMDVLRGGALKLDGAWK